MLREREGQTGLVSSDSTELTNIVGRAMQEGVRQASTCGNSGSETVIQMTGAVTLWVHEHGGAGDIAIAVPAAEDEDRQRLSFHFLPLDRGDLPPDQFCVVLAFDFRRRAHDWE